MWVLKFITPVNVDTKVSVLKHFIFSDECETFPNFKAITLFLELPAALILPFSLIFKPLQPNDLNSLVKKLLNKYSKYRNMDLVFQKLILFISEASHLLKKCESCKLSARCII